MAIMHHASNAAALWVIGMVCTAIALPILCCVLPSGLAGLTHVLDAIALAVRS